MNLIDAIRSGKPFRRIDSCSWLVITDDGTRAKLKDNRDESRVKFSVEDLATEWEIEEPSVTITKTQFWEAATSSLTECGFFFLSEGVESKLRTEQLALRENLITILAKKLGLQ